MKNNIPVCEPFLNGNELKYVSDAVTTGWISSQGKYVKEFEEKFAKYCNVKYAVSVCNGTVALHLALIALGIGKGDEVIVPNFTMMSSAFAVCYTGAMPVFVEACKDTWNIDADGIEKKITVKTKAVMPVHIFGNPCKMDKIKEIAIKHNIKIIEDAAEAFGSEYKGKKIGSLSDAGCFSFYSNKNITTGEGGMVVTNDKSIFDNLRYYKNVCFPLDGPRVYQHDNIGFNYRMSNIHAAIGLAQVEKADDYVQRRINNGKLYRKYLKNIDGVNFQKDEKDTVNAYWMNGILLDDRYGKTKAELMDHLKNHGVETRLYFIGMNKQKSMSDYGCDCSGDYNVSDNLNKNGFYLPSGSNLQKEQIEYICKLIKDFKK